MSFAPPREYGFTPRLRERAASRHDMLRERHACRHSHAIFQHAAIYYATALQHVGRAGKRQRPERLPRRQVIHHAAHIPAIVTMLFTCHY